MAKSEPVGGKMSLMQRLGKAMDKGRKQTSKALVKGKIIAIQKMAHANITPEVPEITGALERLKATKNEMSALADVARKIYEARINQANFQIEMSHQLRGCRTADNDGWSKLAQGIGMSMNQLESIHSEHCEKMKEQLVAPLEKFRDVDIAQVQKLKLKYKETKSAYDVAIAKNNSAKESGQAAKISSTFGKRTEAEASLKAMRGEFVSAVEGLERYKNTELLGLVLDYWDRYVNFCKAQSNSVQHNKLPDGIDASNYHPPLFATLTPGDGPDPEAFGGPEFVTNFHEQNESKQDQLPPNQTQQSPQSYVSQPGLPSQQQNPNQNQNQNQSQPPPPVQINEQQPIQQQPPSPEQMAAMGGIADLPGNGVKKVNSIDTFSPRGAQAMPPPPMGGATNESVQSEEGPNSHFQERYAYANEEQQQQQQQQQQAVPPPAPQQTNQSPPPPAPVAQTNPFASDVAAPAAGGPPPAPAGDPLDFDPYQQQN